MPAFVYIMTNAHHTVLYIGATIDLVRRTRQHREHYYRKSFTDRYNVEKLIWFEYCDDMKTAFLRERQLKGWTRIKKEKLINAMNPSWRDLYETILGALPG